MEDRIDIVLSWVDGSDPLWRKEFDLWKTRCTPPCGAEGTEDTSVERYRDWDLLRYLFRGFEKFAPWASRIHLVTWGHLPPWLDVDNPRLNIVKHSDFIPEEYLPTFSSCPIELNLHRIEGLADKFIYFNDDMFLTREVGRERFFKKGLPRDMARLSVIRDQRVDHNILECVRIINSRYSKPRSMNGNLGKWINFRYAPSDLLKTVSLLPWSFFPGFHVHHMPQPFLKRTFQRLWEEEAAELKATCRHRFRTTMDLSQWLMRYEQLASGEFAPHSYRDTALFRLSEDTADGIAEAIRSQHHAMVCLNDNDAIVDLAGVRDKVARAFESILPAKSTFEK